MTERPASPGRGVFRILLPVAVAAGIFFFLIAVRRVLLPFVLSVVLAHLASPVIRMFLSRGWRRAPAVVALYTVLIAALFSGVFYGVRAVASESRNFPAYAAALRGKIDGGALESIPLVGARIDGFVKSNHDRLLAAAAGALPAVGGGVLSLAGMSLLIGMLSFSLMLSAPSILASVIGVVPGRHVERALHLLWKVDETIGKYVRGVVFEACCVGAATYAGLLLAGFKFAAATSVFAGIANLIPFIGPMIAAAAGILLALIQFGAAPGVLMVAAAFLAAQLIDNLVLQPLIVGNSVDLHIFWVLFALSCGGELAGLPGVVLAVPAACVVRLLFEAGWDWYRVEFGIRPDPALAGSPRP